MHDLDVELEQFTRIALKELEKTKSEHDKAMIRYRLDLLRLRFEEYSQQGLTLDEAREKEKARLDNLRLLNGTKINNVGF